VPEQIVVAGGIAGNDLPRMTARAAVEMPFDVFTSHDHFRPDECRVMTARTGR